MFSTYEQIKVRLNYFRNLSSIIFTTFRVDLSKLFGPGREKLSVKGNLTTAYSKETIQDITF